MGNRCEFCGSGLCCMVCRRGYTDELPEQLAAEPPSVLFTASYEWFRSRGFPHHAATEYATGECFLTAREWVGAEGNPDRAGDFYDVIHYHAGYGCWCVALVRWDGDIWQQLETVTDLKQPTDDDLRQWGAWLAWCHMPYHRGVDE